MASTFFALNGLVGCGHMSGLVARRICPLALMKSDDRNIPIRFASFKLMSHNRLFLVFGGDRVVHRVSMRLPNFKL